VQRKRRLLVVLLAVVGAGAAAYGASTVALRSAKQTIATKGCQGSDHPPHEAVWAAFERLETLARLPWQRREAGDLRTHGLWRCAGAVGEVCASARWDAERSARQAMRDERDRRTAAIRTERDRRAGLPDADRDTLGAWERAEEDALTRWEREQDLAPDWRSHLAPEVASMCETWAPTRAALERLHERPSCSVCDPVDPSVTP
jgi:hypothetical protein